MNATNILLVALPVAGAVIGAAGIWLSKHYMPSRRVPAARLDQTKFTVSPAPAIKPFSPEAISVRHG